MCTIVKYVFPIILCNIPKFSILNFIDLIVINLKHYKVGRSVVRLKDKYKSVCMNIKFPTDNCQFLLNQNLYLLSTHYRFLFIVSQTRSSQSNNTIVEER